MAESSLLPAYLGADYPRTYAACKSKELESFEAQIAPIEYSWYLMAD